MKAPYYLFVCYILIQCKIATENQPNLLIEKVEIDNQFEQLQKDPYKYLENLDDSLVIKWYQNQEDYEKRVMDKIPNKSEFLTKLVIYKEKDTIKISNLKITNSNLLFYLRRNSNDNLGNQMYYRRGLKGKEELLYDPNTYKVEEGDNYSINYFEPSWDGSKIVISLVKEDKGISEMIVVDVATAKVFPQVIDHCWPSALGGVRWLPNNLGFTYEYIPVIDKKSKNYLLNTETIVYYIGENPKKWSAIFSKRNNPEIKIKPEDFPEVAFKTETGKYMFGSVSGASYYSDYYYALIDSIKNKKINWKPLFKKEELIRQFEVVGGDIIFLTGKNAQNFKICKTSLTNPNFSTPETLVPEDQSQSTVITDLAVTKKGLYYVKTENGVGAQLYQYKEGKIKNISIPKPAGYINLISNGVNYDDLWVEIKGWVFSIERYRYDYEKDVFLEEYLYPKTKFQIEGVTVEEVEVTSHDGVKVPLSIIYKNDMKLDKKNRLLIQGYGAYGISVKPNLGWTLLRWVNAGGVYAIAHVRGGGEKGDAWHKGGYKTTKPNSWKDFIACTEYLVDKKYTSSSKTIALGSSAGGILIGRAITERPELFAAAIIRVGILNVMRSEFGPNGKNNTKEFGTVTDSLEFKALLEMDAYHHIEKGVKYPALYLTAGMNDARVPVWQPGKFVAKMQAASTSNKPVLFSVDFKGGHGIGASKNKKREELANILSFALWQTGHPDYQVK